ncbi:gephyrin-like molybdotransferase receptor GlpR [Mycobacterium decipiens]|uniref:Transmembrane protein n=1 Tax=Mycobacterium decipiens TaxID=1430326 RepID=A0A1X2LV64_9MYCO|nr:gephyrin-like molybdotransferase receptor GlpR [Mycobacterium decipiens]OSC40958.1 hypothetical protein B8W66_10895 [Mycobacterium decipiens]
MPSIPQSLLWISLVVLWLFVLVPMLISKRDAVRRTSDVALATRVLNGGAGARLLKRGGPAAGHRSDPDWKPEEEWRDDAVDEEEFTDVEQDPEQGFEEDAEPDNDEDDEVRRRGAVVVTVAAPHATGADEPDYLDVDVVDEDSGALPAGASARAGKPALPTVDDPADDADPEVDRLEPADDEYEYEYVEDTCGLEVAEDDSADIHEAPPRVAHGRSRRRRFDTKTAAAVTARKYAFRKRVLIAMAVMLIGSATAAFEVTPAAWWICGSATGMTVLYLAYLRRQTRIEEKVRRRRMQRMARARLGVENTRDRDYDLVPSRLRRPGAVVLEIDDEDPIFSHLDYAMPSRGYGWPRDLPRAVGQ